MKQHLNSEQISRWMAGERSAQEELHIRECAQCAEELARFEGTLRMFRGSVRRLSEQEVGSVPQAVRHSGRVQPRLRWAVALAALLLAVAIPFYRHAMNQRRQLELAKADAALLEQIDAEVSRSVPAHMEPLITLVAWDSTSNQGGGSTTR